MKRDCINTPHLISCYARGEKINTRQLNSHTFLDVQQSQKDSTTSTSCRKSFDARRSEIVYSQYSRQPEAGTEEDQRDPDTKWLHFHNTSIIWLWKYMGIVLDNSEIRGHSVVSCCILHLFGPVFRLLLRRHLLY